MTIGRAPESDLRPDDPYGSRRHAVVRRTGDQLVIEDADLRAGVVVNHLPTSGPTALREGDHGRLGRVELELRRITRAPDRVESHGIRFDGDSDEERTRRSRVLLFDEGECRAARDRAAAHTSLSSPAAVP